MRRLLSPSIGLVLVLALATPAAAQGRGGGNGNGRPKEPGNAAPAPPPASPDTAASSAVPAPTVTSFSYRQFGAWLDDASAPFRGEGYTTLAIGHWRMDGVTQTNVPMIGAGIGVTDRLQVGANVPFYRVNWTGGSATGLDDVYLNAKYTILDPTLTLNEVGVAVSPVIEILSSGAPNGRVHFALPVSLEIRRLPFRAYGSAGYFTRGAFFGGAALEWTAPGNLTITGSLTRSYSLPEDDVLDALAVSRSRTDVSVGLGYPIGTRAVAFASVGRSLSALADGGTSLAVTGGVAVRFSVNAAQP